MNPQRRQRPFRLGDFVEHQGFIAMIQSASGERGVDDLQHIVASKTTRVAPIWMPSEPI
jgi:hypothetical protein